MRAALIQMKVQKENDVNIRTACTLIRHAAGNGADLVMLPEMFCCPYETVSFPVYAQPEGGPNWSALSACARENHVYLVAGSMPECAIEERGPAIDFSLDETCREKNSTDKNGTGENTKENTGDNNIEAVSADRRMLVYNTSFVFNREGEQVARHRKVHLFDVDIMGGQRFFESETLTAGSEVTVFDTEFGKIGLMICFDIRFPELARLMALQGVRMILVPAAFNLTTGPAHWELAFRSRAVDNQVFLLGCSPARDMESSYHAYGHSLAVNPWGDIIAQLDEQEGILYCDLDLQMTDEIRAQLPLLEARRTDLYEVNARAL